MGALTFPYFADQNNDFYKSITSHPMGRDLISALIIIYLSKPVSITVPIPQLINPQSYSKEEVKKENQLKNISLLGRILKKSLTAFKKVEEKKEKIDKIENDGKMYFIGEIVDGEPRYVEVTVCSQKIEEKVEADEHVDVENSSVCTFVRNYRIEHKLSLSE